VRKEEEVLHHVLSLMLDIEVLIMLGFRLFRKGERGSKISISFSLGLMW
jgi:hypothetical protein